MNWLWTVIVCDLWSFSVNIHERFSSIEPHCCMSIIGSAHITSFRHELSYMWFMICFTKYSWDIRFSLPYCPSLGQLIWTRITMNDLLYHVFSLKFHEMFHFHWAFTTLYPSLDQLIQVHISKNRHATCSHQRFIRILSFTVFSLPYAHY